MSAPVDVLAVMDSCTDELEKQPGCYYTDAAKLQEARATIAKLIEANHAALKLLESVCPHHPQTADLRATLARVGGAK